MRRVRDYSSSASSVSVAAATVSRRGIMRSSRSWHRTQVVTSGMARSRAGAIVSPHSSQTPYSPPRRRSRASASLFSAVHQQAPRHKTHLPVLVDPDHVHFVGKRQVTQAASELFEGHHATHVPDPLHRVAELSLKALLDLVHRPVSPSWAPDRVNPGRPAGRPLVQGYARTLPERDGSKGSIFAEIYASSRGQRADCPMAQ